MFWLFRQAAQLIDGACNAPLHIMHYLGWCVWLKRMRITVEELWHFYCLPSVFSLVDFFYQ